MKKATITNIKRLNARSDTDCISIYMPVHAGAINYQKDSIIEKHVLSTLKAKLGSEADATTRRTYKRIQDKLAEIMEVRSSGTVCLFDNFKSTTVLFTPTELDAQVYRGKEFVTDILASTVAEDKTYYVLTLSQHAARLYRATKTSFKLQQSLDENTAIKPMMDELNIDELNTSVNTHPTGEGASKGSHGFHGFGSLKDQRKDLIESYFRKIDAKLLPIMKKADYPVILAGVNYLLPIYRKISKYDDIQASELHGNMDHVSNKKLFELVLPLITA